MNKLIIAMLTLFSISCAAKEIRPQKVSEFRETSVRIYSTTIRSGGTGSILRSSTVSTDILTNKHICRIIEMGGVVKTNSGKTYQILRYKKYKEHDLCIVQIVGNLGVSTRIARRAPKITSKTYMSGHPQLLPHIVNKGHLSDRMPIQLMVGTIKCTEEDRLDPDKQMECMFFGSLGIFKTFETRVVSNLIQGGNSGSAVFNSYGEIVGVAFAGRGEISYGFIVPYRYVVDFLNREPRIKWTSVGTELDNEGMDERFFNYKDCTSKFNPQFCSQLKLNKAWSN